MLDIQQVIPQAVWFNYQASKHEWQFVFIMSKDWSLVSTVFDHAQHDVFDSAHMMAVKTAIAHEALAYVNAATVPLYHVQIVVPSTVYNDTDDTEH